MTSSLTPGTDTDHAAFDDDRAQQPGRCARAAAQAVRDLNHLTQDPVRGYVHAADVYDVLGNLRELAYSFRQSIGQAARWLAQAESLGRLSDIEASTAAGARATVVEAVASLTFAAGYAASLASDLATAQCEVGRLATDVAEDAPVPFVPAVHSDPSRDGR